MSSTLIKSTPYDDGYVMPAEFEPQRGVWLLLATNDTWRNGGFPIRETQVEIAKAIAKSGTSVYVGVAAPYYLEAEKIFRDIEDVSIYDLKISPWLFFNNLLI